MAVQPIYATAIGDRRLPGRAAARTTDGAIDRERRRLAEQLDRTREIPPDGMTPAERVTRDALVDTLEFELGVVESGVARWAVDPLDGPQVTFLNIPSFQPLATVEDGEALLARWREMGPWIDRHVAGLRASARDGLVAPRALVGQRRRRARRPPCETRSTRGRWPGRRPPILPAGLARNATGSPRRSGLRSGTTSGRRSNGSGHSSPTSWRRSPAPTTGPG